MTGLKKSWKTNCPIACNGIGAMNWRIKLIHGQDAYAWQRYGSRVGNGEAAATTSMLGIECMVVKHKHW